MVNPQDAVRLGVLPQYFYMNDKLFIPSKIKVGYQHRFDTYTQKLAYVIYYNSKGKLCKETSWLGWIHDEEVYRHVNNAEAYKCRYNDMNRFRNDPNYTIHPPIAPDEFENVPMEGFVLNKKAGGYSTGWNQRQMKCRVFDPRGFEFEIAIDNLLFILQVTNSYKGKGLEGQFVYAWCGSDIVLLPCESEDYVNSREFTDMKSLKVYAKSLVEGYTYLHKNMDSMIFMGKQDFINWPSYRKLYGVNKEYVFYDITNDKFLAVKPPNIAKILDESVHVDYAEIVDKMQASGLIKCFEVEIKDAPIDFNKTYDKSYYELSGWELIGTKLMMKTGVDTYTEVDIYAYFEPDYNNMNYYDRRVKERPETEELCRVKHPTKVYSYQLNQGTRYKIVGNDIEQIKYDSDDYRKRYSVEDVEAREFKKINLIFPNGTSKPIITY